MVISCRNMGGGMVYVTSAVRSSCVGSQAPRPELGRGVDCARGQGLGEALIALEARARARRWITLEARARASRLLLHSTGPPRRAEGKWVLLILRSSFAAFLPLDQDIPVYGTRHYSNNISIQNILKYLNSKDQEISQLTSQFKTSQNYFSSKIKKFHISTISSMHGFIIDKEM